MWHRFGVLAIGTTFLVAAAGELFVIFKKHNLPTTIMEGSRGTFFAVLGVSFALFAVFANPDTVRSLLREFAGNLASRKTVREFAVFGLAIGATLVMLPFIPH